MPELRQRTSGCPMPELRQRRSSCPIGAKRQAGCRFLLDLQLLVPAKRANELEHRAQGALQQSPRHARGDDYDAVPPTVIESIFKVG
jgi:hypothetical protein